MGSTRRGHVSSGFLLRMRGIPQHASRTLISYAGGFIHADDIRALSSSTESLENQISIVDLLLIFLEGKPCEIERPKV